MFIGRVVNKPITGFFGWRQLDDQLGDVVLEKLFLLGLEEVDDGAAVGRVGAGQAEIERLPGAPNGTADETEFVGAILRLRERLRIDHVQTDLAVGASGKFFQELAHAVRIRLDVRDLVGRFTREIEVQVDRLVDVLEDACACRARACTGGSR